MTTLSAIGGLLFLIVVCALAMSALAWFIINKVSNKILKEQRRIIDKVSNKALEQRLHREGVATTAQVLDAADTGSRIDAIFILTRLQLQVAATEGVEEFVIEIVVPLSPVRVAQIVPGTTVKVRVDPVSREVVLDQPRK
ncbi:hypothetical protein [Dyella tabacisoli]|uniref:Uncharacterized protein n=1 Tax=Dyella tabacisoli TaxID=2282381 RepID=A0A369UHT6_9GAMM|nr:hypothetical protein [Dyella tabacisoli]RDD80314.1 hypothetical protein DVJ77_17845 [Dyella tabacisoli]